MFPWEKSKVVSFVSLWLKNIVVFPSLPGFQVKLICCIEFGSASRALQKILKYFNGLAI